MLENKGEGYPLPDKATIQNIKHIEQYESLSKKLEQIGYEVQIYLETKELKKDERLQLAGNINYYMNYLRNLTDECPMTNEEKEKAKKYREKAENKDYFDIGFEFIRNKNGHKMIVWEILKTNHYRKNLKNNGRYCNNCKHYKLDDNSKGSSYYICSENIDKEFPRPMLVIRNAAIYNCDKYENKKRTLNRPINSMFSRIKAFNNRKSCF